MTVKAGDWVSTGAITGVHEIDAGQSARLSFTVADIAVSRSTSRRSSEARGRRVAMLTRRVVLEGIAAGAIGSSARAAMPDGALAAADVHPAGYPTVAAVAWIDEQLQKEFAGALSISSYPSGQLGTEKDTLELARLGAIAVTRVNSSVLNNVIPATRILSLPYVFDSTEHMRRAFDASFGDEILAACNARGMLGLAIYDSGSRNLYSTRRPVATPADLHGLKLRVPQSDIFIESVAALGATQRRSPTAPCSPRCKRI